MTDEMSKTKSGTEESGMTDALKFIQFMRFKEEKRVQERIEEKERYERERERYERERREKWKRYEKERRERREREERERRERMERFERMQEERNRERREEWERYERERRERMERFERMQEERNRDSYNFYELLKSDNEHAQTKRETDQTAKEDREQRNYEVKLTKLEESIKDITTEFGHLDTEFFQVTTPKSKVIKTRSQKRENRKAYQKRDKEMETKIQDIAPENLKDLQTMDKTLDILRQQASQQTEEDDVQIIYKDGLMYRKVNREDLPEPLEQLVLAKECRQRVVKVSHDVLLAGNFGKKTTLAIMVELVKDNMEKAQQRQMKGNNNRLTRRNLDLQPFCYEVIHRKGLSNGHANGLTRTGQG